MRIRQLVFVLTATAASGVLAQETKGVITLPGVHATATPGCVEHSASDGSNLSYACLNQLVASSATTVPLPSDADITTRPTNTLGLYNANSLSHRMGPNLGISVQPYRPKVTYPTPLAPPPAR